MTGLLPLAVLSTLTLEGEVPQGGGDYFTVEFEVPAEAAEIQVAHTDNSDRDILDWGLWDPDGFRGWGGGLEDDAIVGATAASRGYLPGPLPAGTWEVVVGKAKIVNPPGSYSITITIRDAETLSARPRAEDAQPVLESGARWYSGDFHVHSRESGDASATFGEITDLARGRGLDFVVLSDHNTVSQHALAAAYQAELDDFLLVRGVEITTYGGHGNAFGVERYTDHRIGYEGNTVSDLLADVEAQGGLFSVNHPRLDLGDACIGCAWDHETDWTKVAAIELHNGPFDLYALFTGPTLEMWEELFDQGHRLTAIGGSDDHRAGIDLSAQQSPIGSPTTLVYAEELSEAGILEAVREGRAILKLRGPDDPLVELFVEGAGGERGMIGDTVEGARVTVEARAAGATGYDLVLYRNGEPVESTAVDSEDFSVRWTFKTDQEGDRYRAHLTDGALQLVITNHVYVDYAPAAGCGCQGGGSGRGGLALLAFALAAALRRRRRELSSSVKGSTDGRSALRMPCKG